MYLELFKLNELPFRLAPDPAFLFLSKHHAQAKAYLESTAWFTDGFVVISGEIGSGKTTLLESFLATLGPEVIVAQINQTQLSATEFLQMVLVQFGFKPFNMQKAELLVTLNQFLIEQYAQGRQVLLIVDEAQNLSSHVLEEVRLLSGVETTKEKVLRIILVGQPELNDKLDAPALRQLAQRVRLRLHLTPLSPEDTAAYVQHRLRVAGSQDRSIFTPDTFILLYQYTRGIPRLINTLCDTAMMAAFTLDRDRVEVADVRNAVDELRWTKLATPTTVAALQHKSIALSSRDKPMGHLMITRRGQLVAEHAVRLGRIVIGRTPDNDVSLASQFISRHHAQVIATEESVVIEDLNSTNGIVYHSRRIKRHALTGGELFLMGDYTVAYISAEDMNTTAMVPTTSDESAVLEETVV